METVFAGSIEVRVLRNGKEIDRVVRPLRRTSAGTVVRYKRKLWRVQNDCINVSGAPLVEEPGVAEDPSSPQPESSRSAAFPPLTQLVIVSSLTSNPPHFVLKADCQDNNQSVIVAAGPGERLLVDAGPGTGKTHTACLKVASLISQHDIPPSRIWMISFTRTAVHEIRTRLAVLLPNPDDAASVRIATLDSLAWTIHSGFSKDAALTGSYDDNISQTLAKIRTNPEVREDLEKVRHVVVDEAQDIVGVRAELVLSIIDAVAPECGVTTFADQAQAIYGFTEDEDDGNITGTSLVQELEDREFKSVRLTEIHRTESPTLLRIFRDVRRKVLETNIPALSRGAEIRKQIEQLADTRLGPPGELKFSVLPPTALVLMRQRSEVLTASSFNQTTPHRLRMSGLPVRILPWAAMLFWDYIDRRVTRGAFEGLWQTRIAGQTGAPAADAAWKLLYETAGVNTSVVDLHRLRAALGRSNPPAAFTSAEYGDSGPIIGTIHASKGREAEEVFLYLPPLPEENDEHTDADEEVRVMFVGATRARKTLAVGSSNGKRFGNVDGRFWKRIGRRLQVEIGRMYDIDAMGLVGKSAFGTADGALAAQQRLLQTPIMEGMFAFQAEELGWSFALQTADKIRVGVLSESVKADLREIAKQCDCWKPPNYLPHIRSIGLRSTVVRTDDSVIDQLYEPWRSSGFLFAPMLMGICTTKLRD